MTSAGGKVEGHPARPHPDDAVAAPAGQAEVVQADEQRAAAVGDHLAEQVHHFLGPGRVEARHRLVGEDQLGLLHEHPGQRHPLLLAAGEPVGALEELVGDADPGQGGAGGVDLDGADQRAQGSPPAPCAEPAGVDVVHHPQRPDQVRAAGRRSPPGGGRRAAARGVASPGRGRARRPRPLVGRTLPVQRRRTVVLPAPLGPTRATRSPAFTSRSKPSSAACPS